MIFNWHSTYYIIYSILQFRIFEQTQIFHMLQRNIIIYERFNTHKSYKTQPEIYYIQIRSSWTHFACALIRRKTLAIFSLGTFRRKPSWKTTSWKKFERSGGPLKAAWKLLTIIYLSFKFNRAPFSVGESGRAAIKTFARTLPWFADRIPKTIRIDHLYLCLYIYIIYTRPEANI